MSPSASTLRSFVGWHVGGEEAHLPLAVDLLGSHEGYFGVEKQVELVHPHLEEPCEEVPQFVLEHQDGQTEDEL